MWHKRYTLRNSSCDISMVLLTGELSYDNNVEVKNELVSATQTKGSVGRKVEQYSSYFCSPTVLKTTEHFIQLLKAHSRKVWVVLSGILFNSSKRQ